MLMICRAGNAPLLLEKQPVEVLIPSSAVGVVIGKGGGTIDALQKESGCRIRVPKEGLGGADADERVVLLSGGEEAIERARGLIEKKLQEHAEQRVEKHCEG